MKKLSLNDLEDLRIQYNTILPILSFESAENTQIELLNKVPQEQQMFLMFPRTLSKEDLNKTVFEVDVKFVPHCERKYCELGEAYFVCTSCNKETVDVEVSENSLWWTRKFNSNIGICMCHHCRSSFVYQKINENKFKMIKISNA